MTSHHRRQTTQKLMKKKLDTWNPSPVPSEKGTGEFIPFLSSSEPRVTYHSHLVVEARRIQQEAMAADFRRSQLVAIAAAYVHDCDQFDDLVFTGHVDLKRGKQPSSEAERSASSIFAARRRTFAAKQARDGGWSESELMRALNDVIENERRVVPRPTPSNEPYLLFKNLR